MNARRTSHIPDPPFTSILQHSGAVTVGTAEFLEHHHFEGLTGKIVINLRLSLLNIIIRHIRNAGVAGFTSWLRRSAPSPSRFDVLTFRLFDVFPVPSVATSLRRYVALPNFLLTNPLGPVPNLWLSSERSVVVGGAVGVGALGFDRLSAPLRWAIASPYTSVSR